jgi:hypothetical protein
VLNLEHPTYCINVKTSDKVDRIALKMGTTNFHKELQYDSQNNLWYIIFEEPVYSNSQHKLIKSIHKTTINFSRIDMELQIYTNTDKEIKIQYWNEHLNCARRCNGFCGYGYGYTKA